MTISSKSCLHKPIYKITYDIGNGNNEELLLCDECYSSNESFRKWILEIKEIKN